MQRRAGLLLAIAIAAAGGVALLATDRGGPPPATAANDTGKPQKPALTVAPTRPQTVELKQTIEANGNVAAWQEAVVGAEIGGYRLTEVLVNVGDVVRKGQLLAQVSTDVVAAEVALAEAALTEARAALVEARANADRGRRVQASGAMTAQQIQAYLTAEQTAQSRVEAAQARLATERSRLGKLRIVAPDDGVIAARTATVGAAAQPGQELFRLIRGGRLEWRAEVTAAELSKLRPGMLASVRPPSGGAPVTGKVRTIAPTVDAQTRMGIVYVDLPAAVMTASDLRAGMFARGEFELGRSPALTLPQSAIVTREGFAYAFRIGPESRVTHAKIATGRRIGDRVEVTSGLTADDQVVASGAGFLADGDVVKVVTGGR